MIRPHAIGGVDAQESAYYLTLSQVYSLLAMCHGAAQQAALHLTGHLRQFAIAANEGATKISAA